MQMALTVCGSCPVRSPCLDDALIHEDAERGVFGVRGGLTAAERIEMIRHRPRVGVVAVVVDVGFEEQPVPAVATATAGTASATKASPTPKPRRRREPCEMSKVDPPPMNRSGIPIRRAAYVNHRL
jgi:hypothetical protein